MKSRIFTEDVPETGSRLELQGVRKQSAFRRVLVQTLEHLLVTALNSKSKNLKVIPLSS